jgi:hypothetical protein
MRLVAIMIGVALAAGTAGCGSLTGSAAYPGPGPDVDCAGGSGDGPRYVGTVKVPGADLYGLDRDGDGIGCE